VVFGAGGHARAVVDVLERLGETVVAVVGDAGGSAWHVEVLPDDEAGLARVGADGLCAVVAIGAVRPRLALLAYLAEIPAAASSIESAPLGPDPAPSSIESAPLGPNRAHSIGGMDPKRAHSIGGKDPNRAHSIERGGAGTARPVVAATATVGRDAELGAGTVVLEHAHVGPASRLGTGVIVNTGAIVEHDCTVGDGVHIAPGAVLLGGASVGARTLVGSGARVLPRVVVGADVTIGAGAVVTDAVPDGRTVVGVPARAVDHAGGEQP
jgi:UDP-perosamine 4-acetyltransferase